MKTARVSSFTFACTTLAVALSAGASNTPLLQVNVFDQQTPSQQLEAPSIVLTPPTPRPDIGILRLPVTGMHTPPRPITVGTTIFHNSNDTALNHTEPSPPPGAGIRPMAIEEPHQAEDHSDGSIISPRKVHKKPHRTIYVPPPHPNRGPPNQKHRRDGDASAETTRTDSSGKIHIARVRDFVAKAEFRNRKRSEGSRAKQALAAMEFGSIDVVSSPSKVHDADSDLERVDVGLGDGLNVGAIVMPSSSGSGEDLDSSSSGSKGDGGKKSSHNKHPHSSKTKNKDESDSNDVYDDSSSSGSGSGSGSHSGSKAKITWYAGHQLLNPACGGPTPTDDSLIAAVNRHSPFASCGDVIKLRSPKNGRSVTVKVVDWCDTCSPNDPWFDLTKGAFEKIADLEIGVVKGLEFERVKSGSSKSNERRDSHDSLVNSILGGDFGGDSSSPASSLFGTLGGVLDDGSASSGSSSAPSGKNDKDAASSDEDTDPVSIGDDDDGEDQEDCEEDDA
ncbi:hypothetical protein OC846_004802 [Tilletia horrida]|uniref:RlpA-like protein double-psi beta-barrel domain-containing protein n=1 Tax=Tilletia horrida TaxID=155126 RepID=A0AAN6JSE5_9BASI|nr:hypothetical protein OC846_004802 [Tilletia horrida]KAK0563030.1 hypothetical protein OC861_005029 [Tilletia horrida]